ncbi:hypothetical protein Taro_021379 [Colocasia esculenta]|uniref:Uncharacterized protein n=1 Tax=Colocasia esculenta TaxID=4460 RepID=A0A843VBA8_COLES|nr:hypothetical protein [Colocasia esculenta]
MDAEAGSHGDGDAAIRAMGPLFRITEVFVWDNASSGISKSSTRHDSSPQEDSSSTETRNLSNLEQAVSALKLDQVKKLPDILTSTSAAFWMSLRTPSYTHL